MGFIPLTFVNGTSPSLNANNLNTKTQKELESQNNDVDFYRSGKDAFDIFTTLEWKRADTTLLKKSVLSGGTAPEYTTRTLTYYEDDGSTIRQQYVFTLSYDGDGFLISEVL